MQITLNHAAIDKAGSNREKLKELGRQVGYFLSMPSTAQKMLGSARLKNVKTIDSQVQVDKLESSAVKQFLANKYQVPTDNPHLDGHTNRHVQFIHENMPELDMGYMALFHHVDMTSATQSYFEILGAHMKAAWNVRKPGEKIKLRTQVFDNGMQVKMVELTDGLQILDQWLQFKEYYKIEQMVAEFINSFYDKKAAYHYGLFVALKALVTFDVSGSTDDVEAMNDAAAKMHRKLRGKGLPGGENTGLNVLCNPESVGKVEKILTATRGSAIVDNGTVSQPLTARIDSIISTTHVPTDDNGYYLIRKGGKIQTADWMLLTTESDRDILTSAEQIAGRAQYNCAIGEQDQVMFVPFK